MCFFGRLERAEPCDLPQEWRPERVRTTRAHGADGDSRGECVSLGARPEVSHHAIKDGWYVAAMKTFGDLFDIVTVHWYPMVQRSNR